jgi:Xaa-Pro aminopeptidase
MYYLTGFDEPESVLVLSKVHAEHRAVMFVRPRDKERELWDGERAGVEGAKERCGVDATFSIAELRQKLPEYLTGADQLVYEVGKWPELDRLVTASITQARARGRTPKPWPRTFVHPERVWHEHRLQKDGVELEAMRKAAAISVEAHVAAMRAAGPGKNEYEIDAVIRDVFRRNGSLRAAYPPIVGSGTNATVLHYRANNRRMEAGELLLVDAGCEYAYYASDITRTFPVGGTFNERQRRIYRAVLDAQLAAIELAQPGSTIERIHRASLEQLCRGLVDIGLLSGSVEEALEKESYKRFCPHRTSHWLGMDVHDVGSYFERGEPRPLAAGMVLTIEPGIYVSAGDEEAPPEYRGIGVRIEDDVLITESGHDILTSAAPKAIDQVERACRG